MLDAIEREDGDIGDVGQQVKQDDNPAAIEQRTRKIAPGLTHLAADKCDIRPRRLCEERADHGLAKQQRDGETTEDSKARLRRFRTPAVSPRIPPIRGQNSTVRAPAENQSDDNDAGKGGRFGKSEAVLDQLADMQTARVRECQERDEQNRAELFRRKTQRIAG